MFVISGGKEFHDIGSLAIKAEAPQFVVNLGTVRLFLCRVVLLVTLWTVENECSQTGYFPLNVLYISLLVSRKCVCAILNHLSSLKAGETWSYFFMLPILTLAAKFCSFCTLCIGVASVGNYILI